MMKLHRLMIYSCLAVFTVVIMAACGYSSDRLVSSPLPTPTNCRSVTHALGETCIPVSPQRMVTIDPFSLENVLALGMQPAGIVIDPDWIEKRSYLQARLANVKILSGHQQPNLEKILAIKPDLILGLDSAAEIYSKLTQIAPTVLTHFETSADWKTLLAQHAEVLNRSSLLAQIMADYDNRLDQLKNEMGARLSQTSVSVVRLYPEGISVYDKNSFIGVVLDDAGLPRPPAQAQMTSSSLLSKELFRDADGDIMFIWSNETGQQINEAHTMLQKLQRDPLWKQLKAVQQNRVYQVPSYWIGSSILSAHAVIDDLFKYLLQLA